ncbi:MAG: helix-turn-helix domain-containing protein [Corynebacterium sp.]|uniref:helix-turn-helix domain-containing protein n=1 Tax=Corynebacterium TaxID=1716 RepID=UPI0006413A1B|nr:MULTISPECIES: helix-turn-helix domain-containing protein [Corynebacterium]MDO5099324.1 helix-turn-helix domain-containing protein [Corynebacterium sp.]
MTTEMPPWLTVTAAADYMGCSKETVRRLINERKLVATYFTPRTLRVSRESIDNLAAKNTA